MLSRNRKAALMISVLSPALIGATLEQWRQRPPRWEMASTRSLAELQGCLGSRWAGTLSAKVQSLVIERGVSFTNVGSNRDFLVDVVDEGDHRVVRLWLRNFLGVTAGAREQIAKLSACAQS